MPQIVVVPGGGARYLPAYYNGQQILWRSPWALNGEIVLPGNKPEVFVALPPATLQNTTDKPFEIMDMKAAADQSADDDPYLPLAEPAPGIMHWWRLTMKATGLNEEILAPDVLAKAIFDIDNAGGACWPWYMPFTLDQTQGFQMKFSSQLPANFMRIAVTFRGSLLTLGPATQRGGQPG
jgi:hypothetical protein